MCTVNPMSYRLQQMIVFFWYLFVQILLILSY